MKSLAKAVMKKMTDAQSTVVFRRLVLALLFLPSLVVSFSNNAPGRSRILQFSPISSGDVSTTQSILARRQQQQQQSSTRLRAIPEIEKWRILNNGSVQGTVKKHPSIPDGDIITTSPLKAPNAVGRRMIVVTGSGSKYKLLDPLETPKKGGTKTVNKRLSTARKSPSIPISQANVPILDDWELLDNNSVQGFVFNHPTIPDGQIINTSTLKNPKLASQSKIVSTVSGSKYKLGEPEFSSVEAAGSGTSSSSTSGGFGLFSFGSSAPTKREGQATSQTTTGSTSSTLSPQVLRNMRAKAQRDYGLNGESIGQDVKYLLAGSPIKSTSGKSLIYRAYRADEYGLPVGDVENDAITVKISSNNEAIEREANNYRAIANTGLTRGKFVTLLEYLSADEMNSSSGRSKKQCALVMERGEEDLKTYLSRYRDSGSLSGKELRDAAVTAAQCVQAAHDSGLVWTDLKTENFVVMRNGGFLGIDLESAMPVNGSPVDYSPEACPPEFARAFLDGDGPYFTLQTNYDIWSLGMLFYELGTGGGYFDGKTPIQITRELAQMEKFEIDPSVSMDGRFKSLVESCLQVNPTKRPSIAQILLHPYFLTTGVGPFSF